MENSLLAIFHEIWLKTMYYNSTGTFAQFWSNFPFFMTIPSLSILAFPKGIVKSLSLASSEIGKAAPYNISFSRTTTGLSSRMADFNNPLQSSAVQGDTT